MEDILREKGIVIGNKELREDMLRKMKEEFDIVHEVISKNQMAPEKLKALIDGQLGLYGQIVREARALGGENRYMFPPHAFEN